MDLVTKQNSGANASLGDGNNLESNIESMFSLTMCAVDHPADPYKINSCKIGLVKAALENPLIHIHERNRVITLLGRLIALLRKPLTRNRP